MAGMVLVAGGGLFPLSVSATTVDELQGQIKELLAKVAELTKKMNALKGEGSAVSTEHKKGDGSVFETPKHRICSILNRNLSQGTKGDDVQGLQEFLGGEGYLSANATGYFGSATADALKRWQSSQGVQSVGTVGPMTRERIKMWCGGGMNNNNNARFGATPQRGAAPLTVTFKTNVSLMNSRMIADGGAYKVVFGDGAEYELSCTGGNPRCEGPHTAQHTYTTDGIYTASLVRYGGLPMSGGPDSKTLEQVLIVVGSDVGCTREYKPVCGSKPIICITTPCIGIQTNYLNKCTMESSGATFLNEGQCGVDYGKGNKPPTISGFSGPTTLPVNESGTWTVNASDPENGNLTYKVMWGDEGSAPAVMAASARDAFVQSTTFTHAYSSAGVYTVSIVVRDNVGKEAKTSSTVKVGGNAVACTMEYAPVCGQPQEPACRRSIPACMMATPGPQTYSNRCMMDAEGATFLYSGACTATSI